MNQPNTLIRASRFYDNVCAFKQQHLSNPFVQRVMNEFEIAAHRLLLYAQQQTPLALNTAFNLLEERLARCALSPSCLQNATRSDISLKKNCRPIPAIHSKHKEIR